MTTRHRASTEHWYFVFPLCCHNNETCAPIPYLPSGAQLEDTPYRSPKLHPGPCSSVGMWQGTDTVRQTHRWAWPLYILRHLQLTWKVTTTTTDVANMDPEQYCLRDVYAYVHVARHTPAPSLILLPLVCDCLMARPKPACMTANLHTGFWWLCIPSYCLAWFLIAWHYANFW